MEVINNKEGCLTVLHNIKSNVILKQIFSLLNEKKLLQITLHNKYLYNRLNMGIKDFKSYNQIIIEIFPTLYMEKNYFFNYLINDKKEYYHVYFNGETKEINKNYFTKEDNVTKIKLIIDYEISSLKGLFNKCECIKKIKFIKFNRKNIIDMSWMFSGCYSLKEIDLTNFNTTNVTNMSHMFNTCSFIK